MKRCAAQPALDELAAEAQELTVAGAPPEDVRRFQELARGTAKVPGSPKAAVAFAKAMRLTYASTATPPGRLEDVNARNDPPAVMAYADKGPETLDAARELYAQWGRGTKRHDAKTYLEAHLEPGNFVPTGKTVNGGAASAN